MSSPVAGTWQESKRYPKRNSIIFQLPPGRGEVHSKPSNDNEHWSWDGSAWFAYKPGDLSSDPQHPQQAGCRAGEMALWVKCLLCMPDNLRSTPRGRRETAPQKLSVDLHMHTGGTHAGSHPLFLSYVSHTLRGGWVLCYVLQSQCWGQGQEDPEACWPPNIVNK